MIRATRQGHLALAWAALLVCLFGLPWWPVLGALLGQRVPVLLHALHAAWQRQRAQPRFLRASQSAACLPPPHQQYTFIGHGGPWQSAHSHALHAASAATVGLRRGPAWQPRPTAVCCQSVLLTRNVLALGSPGSGKSSLAVLLAWQAQRRGEAVVMLDPKGSRTLHRLLLAGARMAGRPFLALLPADPARSAAYDPLAECGDAAAVASRLCGLIEGEGPDPFREFSRGVLLVLAQALQALRRPVTLAALAEALPDAGERLLQAGVSGPAGAALRTLVSHDRTHFRKMTAPLVPLLALLAGEALAGVLSGASAAHPRVSVGAARQQGLTLYVALDTLGNPALGRALALLLLQDFAAEAARHTAAGAPWPPLHLMVDEAAELACPALLQILGKGREARTGVLIAVQTLADLEWRLGSAAAARVAEGNAAAWFMFRQLDALSRRESESRLGSLANARPSRSLGVVDSQQGLAHRQSQSRSLSATREFLPRIPEAAFLALADLECIAQLPDGQVLHLRLPCPVAD